MKNPIVAGGKKKINCNSCHTREYCLPQSMSANDIDDVNSIVITRKSIKKGQSLIRAGSDFHSIYTVRTGFFKTSITSPSGQEHLLDFRMTGDSLGLDGIAKKVHLTDSIALEDSNVCIIQYQDVEKMSKTSSVFLNHIFNLMSKELNRENYNLLMLQMNAEERLARFLQNLTQNLKIRGYSPSELLLRMTRVEIGQYLGLKLETISRTFTKLSKSGVVSINRRHLQILNLEALEKITGVTHKT